MSLPSASERLRNLDHSQIHNIRNALARQFWSWDEIMGDYPGMVQIIADIIADELEFEERMHGT